jgi:hypothetical protein
LPVSVTYIVDPYYFVVTNLAILRVGGKSELMASGNRILNAANQKNKSTGQITYILALPCKASTDLGPFLEQHVNNSSRMRVSLTVSRAIATGRPGSAFPKNKHLYAIG